MAGPLAVAPIPAVSCGLVIGAGDERISRTDRAWIATVRSWVSRASFGALVTHARIRRRGPQFARGRRVTALPTDAARSALMKRVRRSRTKAEELVAVALVSEGMHYRRNVRALPGSPDFANKSRRWAVFVNGCFWHHHRCLRGTMPKRNQNFWAAKFHANRRRDAQKVHELRSREFYVEIVWECEAQSSARLSARISRLKNGISRRG